jgi:hypothetical protein
MLELWSRMRPVFIFIYESPSVVAWQLFGKHVLAATKVQFKFKVTLRLTVSQSVNLGVEPHLGLMGLITRYLLLCGSYGLDFMGRPLWREDGSVLCICCWPLPAQTFSSPSSLGLVTIFHCLRFETSHFVTSYDSQGHGGGIRPRLHTGLTKLKSQSQSRDYKYTCNNIRIVVRVIFSAVSVILKESWQFVLPRTSSYLLSLKGHVEYMLLLIDNKYPGYCTYCSSG